MSNQSFGHRVNMADQRRCYDWLPPGIREVIWRAPFDYDVVRIANRLHQHRLNGGTEQVFRRALVEKICDDIMKLARKTYGPDHPDAVTSRLERRA